MFLSQATGLTKPNGHNLTPQTVPSTDLLKMDPVTIQATDENVEPRGHEYESPLCSLSSCSGTLITAF